jgi:hypothetical protein
MKSESGQGIMFRDAGVMKGSLVLGSLIVDCVSESSLSSH